MSLFTSVGVAEAAAVLAEARAFGETIALVHRSGSSGTLYALIEIIGSQDKREGRTTSELRRIRCKIPVQSGLSYPTDDTEPIINGDMITWRSRNHIVQPPVLTECNGHVYVVEADEEKPISAGPHG